MARSPDFHGECTALSKFAFHRNIPAGNVNDPFHKGQPQTVPLGGMGGVALIELLENMLAHFRADSAAGVAHLHNSKRTV